MGFLSRLRRGTAYELSPDAGTRSPGTSADRADVDVGKNSRAASPERATGAAPGAIAVLSLNRQTPSQLTTAAERAFMELRRGSND